MSDTLELQVKTAIIDRLGLEVEPNEVDDAAPIFSSLAEGTEYEETSLNLDSIDILEVVLALNAAFDLDIPDDQPEIFTSIGSIAEYIRTQHALVGA